MWQDHHSKDTVGLETDMRSLRRHTTPGIVVGIGDVAVSFLLGDLVTILFSKMFFGTKLAFPSPPCLFLGVIATATSVGIAARLFSRRIEWIPRKASWFWPELS